MGYAFSNCTLAKHIEINDKILLRQAIESKLNDNLIGIEFQTNMYKDFLSSSR